MEPKCPLCNLSSLLARRGTYKIWTLVECPDCALQFFWPLRHPGVSYYHSTYVACRDASSQAYPLAWYHRQFLEALPHDRPVGRTLLDVGCGPGMLLAKARDVGYQALGLDVNLAALQQAETIYGLRPDQLFRGTLEEWMGAHPEKKVEVITAFEVLEHLEDPARFLREVHTVLCPGGILALSVPNRERFFLRRERSDFPPHHLTRWSSVTLCGALQRSGFDILRVAQQPPTQGWAIQHLLDSFAFLNIWRVARANTATAVRQIPGAIEGIRGVNTFLRGITIGVLWLPALLLSGVAGMIRRPGFSLYVVARQR